MDTLINNVRNLISYSILQNISHMSKYIKYWREKIQIPDKVYEFRISTSSQDSDSERSPFHLANVRMKHNHLTLACRPKPGGGFDIYI